MGRTAISRIAVWAANAALGVLCCWFVARILLALFTDAVTPLPDGLATASSAAAPAAVEGHPDPQVILSRNLFNVSTVVDAVAPVVEEEDLEATKLPVRLLGTASSLDPKRSWAAVEDLETRRHQIVRVNDPLKQAKVIRIERRRIVIENGQRREELALDEVPGTGATAGPGAATRAAIQRPQAAVSPPSPAAAPPGVDANLANRVRRLADNRYLVDRNEMQQAARNPAQLFQQARILPKWENGQMVGVQLNAIQAGSLFEQIGIQSGDTVTMMNGVRVDSPENSAGLIRELSESRQFNVVVRGNDGRERTLTYEVQE